MMMIWTLSTVALPGVCKADSLEQTGEWGRGEPGLDRSLKGEQLWIVACCWGSGEATLDSRWVSRRTFTTGADRGRMWEEGSRAVWGRYPTCFFSIWDIQYPTVLFSQEIENWSHLIYSSQVEYKKEEGTFLLFEVQMLQLATVVGSALVCFL